VTSKTVTVETSAAIDEFADDAADRASVPRALEHWIAQGRLGELAKALGSLCRPA
jgi:hypothetical protein